MKVSPFTLLTLAFTLTLPSGAFAQRNDNPRSIPSADKLTRLGQVATAVEAKPLIEKYYAEQEQLFQQRREAILTLKGKPPEEQVKIMQTLVANQRERRQKNRELESRISAMLKQDREERLPKKATAGNGR